MTEVYAETVNEIAWSWTTRPTTPFTQRREYIADVLKARRERATAHRDAYQKLRLALEPINKAHKEAEKPLYHSLKRGEITVPALKDAVKKLVGEHRRKAEPLYRVYRRAIAAADDKFEAALASAFYRAQGLAA